MWTRWKSRSLNDFPNELLLTIWVCGCEPEPDNFPPCSRRLKEFACTVRLVKRRWKTLVDFLAARNQGFWIARLQIRVDYAKLRPQTPEDLGDGIFYDFQERQLGSQENDMDYLEEQSELEEDQDDDDDEPMHSDEHGGACFARRLARFRQGLLTSRGCDITITIDFQKSWRVSNTELSSRSRIDIQLLLLTMESTFSATYFNQVTVLRMRNSQPHAYCHLMEVIANRWPTANRLVEISFEPGRSMFRKETSVSTLIDASGGPALRRVILAGVGRKANAMDTNPFTFPDHTSDVLHHRNLTTLTIPSCSWLMEAVHLPPTHHLNVGCVGPDEISLLFHLFQINTTLRDRLVSLVLGHGYRWYSTTVLSAKSQNRVTFPRLQSLTARELTPRQAVILFAGANFPTLQTVALNIRKGEGYSGQLPVTDTAPFPPYAPAVSSLSLSVTTTRLFNFWLSHTQARSWPIERLEICDLEGWDRQLQLSTFRPRRLFLARMDYVVARSILNSINTQLLQDLCVESTFNWGKLDPMPWIRLPSLKRLTVRQDFEASFIHHLHAEQLEHLVFQFPHDPSLKSIPELDITPNILPSVRYLELQLSFPAVPDLWELLPNIGKMILAVKCNVHDHNLTPENSIRLLLEGLDIKSEVKKIASDAKKIASFPFVRSLLVTLELEKRTTGYQHSWHKARRQDGVEKRIYEIVDNLLQRRREAGARPLVLDGPILIQLEVDKEGKDAREGDRLYYSKCHFHLSEA
jgi:hypothetical protein